MSKVDIPKDAMEFAARFVQKFADLKPLTVGPPDRKLARFQRERYSVVGRPDERPKGDSGVALNAGFNIGYIRCESGKGHCSHSHPDFEVFIPMSGRWAISIEGTGDIIAEPWDVVAVPGGVFHSAVNISSDVGYMMSVNAGDMTAGYKIAPDVERELAELPD
jgi:mannose-6-phosphate isomerase-like protein (cupin superfamily)